MKKYKVVKTYWKRSIGDIVESNGIFCGLCDEDFIALELNGLEEIKEPPKPKELWEKIRNKNPLSADFACKEAAQIATDHFREKMPKRKSAHNSYEEGVQDGIALVNRALFGEEK